MLPLSRRGPSWTFWALTGPLFALFVVALRVRAATNAPTRPPWFPFPISVPSPSCVPSPSLPWLVLPILVGIVLMRSARLVNGFPFYFYFLGRRFTLFIFNSLLLFLFSCITRRQTGTFFATVPFSFRFVSLSCIMSNVHYVFVYF